MRHFMPPPAPLQTASSSIATHLLRQCAAAASLREARRLHALLLAATHSPTEPPLLFIHNNILSMYYRCGSFLDAQQLFDEMPHRNIVSFNAMISAYSRSPRHAHLAFRLFDQLENENLPPNVLTITSLLQASAALGDVFVGSLVHARCVKIGCLDNVRVQTSLLGMYSNCGDVDCAKRVFCHMMDRDVIAWNTIISGHLKNGKKVESLELFRSMLRNGINPTKFTYSLVLNACAKLEDYDSGKLVHAHVLLSGTYVDLPLQNSLLDMYCSCGDTHSAFNVFCRIERPDLVSWNTMIGGYSDNGDGGNAMNMFVRLMRGDYLKPDEYTLAAVISGTTGFPASNYGKPLHAQSEKTGLLNSVYIASTLIYMYFSNEDSVSSQKFFISFSHKDIVLWTDMIAGHVRTGESEDALILFHEMCKEGCPPDSFTISSVLSACADLATLRQGEMIHCLAVKTGNDSEIFVRSSLVDMYAKKGELKSATYIFSCLPKACDLMCWNSMLTGYSHHGKAYEAFRIFFMMLKHGIRPDLVTLLSLLAACNHCGLIDEGIFFWDYMKENRLRRGPKHYSCMISLFSRGGMWDEAEEMIIESPFVDDCMESWRTVLSSCLKNGNLRVGLHAAEQILSINAEDSAASVLLMKLYAATGRWDDVLAIKKRMKDLMVKKDPGLSWIEVKNTVHVFSSGDQLDLENGELQGLLNELMGNLMPTVVDEIM